MGPPLLPYVNQTFNTLTYDFFGHGQTTDSSALISLEAIYHEIITLIEKLNLENVHFVGCRFGAIFAFRFARLYPDLIQSLSLMSMPFYIQKGSYDKEFRTLIQLLRLDRDLMEQKLILDSVYPVTRHKSELIAGAFSRVSSQNYLFMINTLVKENHDQSFDWIDHLKSLKVPILLMHGEFDPIYPAHLSVVLSTYAPNGRALVIPSASCFIMLDQPDLTADFLTSFIFSEKIPVPVTFGHRQIIHEFKDVIEKGYQKTPIRRRFLRMSIMSGDTLVYWNGEPIAGKWNQRNAKELLFFMILNHGGSRGTN
ncbi:alpha/beta hydrolase [Terrilactibacillus sp. S3-3]|nr:alpha/beta hydrolase [Terrilactibacillus sp. S3-3]